MWHECFRLKIYSSHVYHENINIYYNNVPADSLSELAETCLQLLQIYTGKVCPVSISSDCM